MNLNRILAILLQELYITRRSYEVLADIFVFPVMSMVVFGFLSLYLTGSSNPLIAHSILLGIVLWQTIAIVQYSIPVGALWNIWWRNLSNMFITPLTTAEYIIALTISGILKSIIVFSLGALMSFYIFHYNIFEIGIGNLLLFLLNLSMFGFAFGVLILGTIFKFGSRVQAFAWGLLPMLQPLAAVFYPVTILPEPIRFFSYLLPPTHIFEAMRVTLTHGGIQWNSIGIAFFENIIFIILGILFFNGMFKASKTNGQFARNEG